MTAECPTCGEDFPTENGMKVHHATIHGESIADSRVELVCENCGEPYERHESIADGSRFCSKRCRSSAPYEVCADCGDSRHWKQLDEAGRCRSCTGHSCPDCRRGFETEHGLKVHHAQVHDGSIIDDEPRDRDSYRRTGYTTTTCTQCGESIERKTSHVGESRNNFCTTACQAEYHGYSSKYSDRKGSSGTPPSRGEYGDGWRYIRLEAIERDGEECVHCGMSRDEHRSEYGVDLYVHHLTPVREFEDSADAHELENVETVCIPCHAEVDSAIKTAD